MHTIIGSSGSNCVLIILFQLYGSKAALLEGHLMWVVQYDSPTFILEEELIQYKCNLIQLLSTISEIIPCQKAVDIIL